MNKVDEYIEKKLAERQNEIFEANKKKKSFWGNFSKRKPKPVNAETQAAPKQQISSERVYRMAPPTANTNQSTEDISSFTHIFVSVMDFYSYISRQCKYFCSILIYPTTNNEQVELSVRITLSGVYECMRKHYNELFYNEMFLKFDHQNTEIGFCVFTASFKTSESVKESALKKLLKCAEEYKSSHAYPYIDICKDSVLAYIDQ